MRMSDPLILFKVANVTCSSSRVTKLHFALLWRIHCWWQNVLHIIKTSRVEYVKQARPAEITQDLIVVRNCTCQRQFGTGVIAERIAQFHLVVLIWAFDLFSQHGEEFLGRYMALRHLQWKQKLSAFFCLLFHAFQVSFIIRLLEGMSRWQQTRREHGPPCVQIFPSQMNNFQLDGIFQQQQKRAALRKVMNEWQACAL